MQGNTQAGPNQIDAQEQRKWEVWKVLVIDKLDAEFSENCDSSDAFLINASDYHWAD